MQTNFELTMKLSEDPSLIEGDLADFKWLEELTGFEHLGSESMSLSGAGTHYVNPMIFVHNPKLVILRFDKDVQVQFSGDTYGNGQVSGSIPEQIMDERYGYVVVTAPQQTQSVIVTTTETTEAWLVCFGDEES